MGEIGTSGNKSRSNSNARKQSLRALARGLGNSRPGLKLSPAMYVESIEDNLVPGVELRHFETELAQGDGNELAKKFKAAHSSSALAVNCFAPFKDHSGDLVLLEHSSFDVLLFEAKCPTGLNVGNAPNLDILVRSPGLVIGIESKCTEYLSPKRWSSTKPPFKPAYFEQIVDERRNGPWFKAMVEINREPDQFRYLDVAQLVKHAFGLASCFKGAAVTLLYLFWEPNRVEHKAPANEIFHAHRQELDRFARIVSGGYPSFAAMSYHDLWASWNARPSPTWLAAHIANLAGRYEQALIED